MTEAQSKIYNFIVKFWRKEGHAPSVQEIANECGYKYRANAAYHINKLLARGLLVKIDGTRRSLRPAEMTIEQLQEGVKK